MKLICRVSKVSLLCVTRFLLLGKFVKIGCAVVKFDCANVNFGCFELKFDYVVIQFKL